LKFRYVKIILERSYLKGMDAHINKKKQRKMKKKIKGME
jgi:hypothetical protein